MRIFFRLLLPVIFLYMGYLVSIEINTVLDISYNEKVTPESEALANPDSSILAVQVRKLGLRLVDMGGVGIEPDTAAWGSNYEHNVHRFERVFLPDPPYIDPAAFQEVEDQFRKYIERMSAFDVSGIVIPGFLEFVNFDLLGNGTEVYGKDHPYRQRQLRLRASFNDLIRYATDKGMQVFLYTDMIALTPPLKDYFTRKFGGIDCENPEVWRVYQAAASEIYETMPGVAGLMLRIGEAGSVYNKEGWDYTSALMVRTDRAVAEMLDSFLETAGKYDKEIVFRTWSVGVGEIGDMHTNVETYERVLKDIQSERLIVSTKYCQGDFYSWLPFNQTLYHGHHRRIAEFQCRREFEGLNAFPNYMAPLYREALQSFELQNKHFDGLWIWTQEGGPLRAGPLSIYPFYGFNAITDANVYAMGRLSANAQLDVPGVTREWVAGYFGTDSLVMERITRMLLMSHDITRRALYISAFAKYDVRAMGLEPPPMLWIFEWDILTASSSVLGAIYYVCQDEFEEAIQEGDEAVAGVQEMQQLLDGIGDRVEKNVGDFQKLRASLLYQESLFQVLGDYRHFFLHYYRWLDTGNKASLDQWHEAQSTFRESKEKHISRYAADLDFPAYNFLETEEGLKLVDRTFVAIWAARGLLLVLLLAIIIGFTHLSQRIFRGFFYSWTRTWRALFQTPSSREIAGQLTHPGPLIFLFVLLSSAIATFTGFSAPVFATYLIGLTGIYVVQMLLWTGSGRNHSGWESVSIILLPALLLVLFPLIFTAIRGPFYFWMRFWTSEAFRTGFFTVLVFLVCWTYYLQGLVMHHRAGWGVLASIGIVLSVSGIQWVVGSAAVLLIGFEKTLTLFNDELLVLPGGLSRILGITTHLNIPVDLPWWVLYIGGGFMVTGLLFIFVNRRKRTVLA